MKRIPFLEVYSGGICLISAVVMAAILSLHIIEAPLLPIADGQGYAMRAFALYGYLHTARWDSFWTLLGRPNQSLLPPLDLLFFLLPKALAGTAAYVILLNGTTYLVLAGAVFLMARVLRRPAWAPAVFILCSVNNIALIDFYAFYLDMPFLALALLTIAFQMKAWSGSGRATAVIAGILLGLLFFVKPANALIFFATYLISELCFAVHVVRSGATKKDRRDRLRHLAINAGYKLVGFIPVLAAAFFCDAAQTILQLIEQNEVSQTGAPLENGGLLRLFYFPLCFSVCYHVLLLGGLILAALLASRWIPLAKKEESATAFPMQLLIPILISYVILGEFFSFWMLVKPVRALLLMLPLFWFGFGWIWEKRRLRPEPLFFVAILYASLAFSQKAFNVLGTRDQLVEANYQLTMASWAEMPSAWHRGWNLNLAICDFISRDLPPSGIICVNAIETRNALAWRLQKGSLLEGKNPPYEVRNLFDYKGEYYDQSLLGANRVALITLFAVQSSRTAWLQSMGILDYGDGAWCGANALGRLEDMPSIRGEPIGHEFVLEQPLTQADVDQANRSAPFFTAAKTPGNGMTDSIYGRHFSRTEGRRLLEAWFAKRFE
jgi:hypothetical protein